MYGYWYQLKLQRCVKNSTTQSINLQIYFFFENFSFNPSMFHRFTRNK